VPQLQGIRILAVDDDPDALALLREILEATGATVTTADSAQHALDLLEGMTPDVLLADLGMPHMSGLDLIDQVRRSERQALREIPAAARHRVARRRIGPKRCAAVFKSIWRNLSIPRELMAAMAALAGRNKPH
jgi:CheY-like chemotaxis protein